MGQLALVGTEEDQSIRAILKYGRHRRSFIVQRSYFIVADGTCQDHRQGPEFTFERVEGQAKGLQRKGAQERAVAFFAEDHVGPADLIAVLEHGDRPCCERFSSRRPSETIAWSAV